MCEVKRISDHHFMEWDQLDRCEVFGNSVIGQQQI